MKKKQLTEFRQLKAFTLTEIMVVLVIIGILTLIALPNMTGIFLDKHIQWKPNYN